MEALELFGIALVILGVLGMAVMQKNGKPTHHSSMKLGKSNDAGA